MKAILVVGGFGFLGASLVKSLITTSGYKVVVLVKSTTDPYRIDENISSKIDLVYIDNLNLDELLGRYEFHAVINATVLYDDPLKHRVFETNFLFPLKLIERGLLNGCHNYIVFDSFFRKFPEYNQKKAYTASKAYLTEQLQSEKNCRIINLQLEHMYGPYDGANKFVPSIARRIYQREKSIDLTKGEQRRDFIYVGDVADLVLELIEKLTTIEPGYHHIEVGRGFNFALKDFVTLMKRVFDNHVTELRFGSLPENPSEIKASMADLTTIPKLVDWRANTSMEAGIKEIFNSIK